MTTLIITVLLLNAGQLSTSTTTVQFQTRGDCLAAIPTITSKLNKATIVGYSTECVLN
jgi:hypothetical protein